MANVDRAGIIELLGRLGADDKETVLDAARELNRKLSDAGLTWDELLRREPDTTPPGDQSEAPDEPLGEMPADDVPAAQQGGLSAADRAEAARLVERLLARKNISSTLREELGDFKQSIADGSIDAMDSRYIRALAKRLGA
jgi:hypothetical protein